MNVILYSIAGMLAIILFAFLFTHFEDIVSRNKANRIRTPRRHVGQYIPAYWKFAPEPPVTPRI